MAFNWKQFIEEMNLRLLSVAIALVLSAMLLGAGVYSNVVDAPNYMGGPTSLEHARGFYHATSPGTWFVAIVPAAQLFLLLASVCNWKLSPIPSWKSSWKPGPQEMEATTRSD